MVGLEGSAVLAVSKVVVVARGALADRTSPPKDKENQSEKAIHGGIGCERLLDGRVSLEHLSVVYSSSNQFLTLRVCAF
jgi:hypothetical protein